MSEQPLSCKTCRFYVEDPQSAPDIQGECRIRAPGLSAGYILVNNFPRVKRDAWCGEWRNSAPEYNPYIRRLT